MNNFTSKFFILSYLEALFYSLMVATTESFVIFWAVKKGLSFYQISVLTTMPLLIGALCQWILPKFISNSKLSKNLILLMLVQAIGLAGVWYVGAFGFNFTLLTLSMSVYWIGGLTSSPIWLDWQSTVIPSSTLFKDFISKRNSFTALMTLIFYITVGYIFYKKADEWITVVFFMGFLARILCAILQYRLSLASSLKNEALTSHISIKKIIHLEPEMVSILKRFFLWTGLFKFAVNLSSPFCLPYMVKTLHFTMLDYAYVTGFAFLGRAICLKYWAKASDGFKPFLGLQICAILISTVPILWMFSGSIHYLSFLELCSGVYWGGFELSCILIIQNFIQQDSRKFLGLHMAIMNVFGVLGSLVGALFLSFNNSYLNLFFFSSFIRGSIVLIFIIYLFRWPKYQLTWKSFKYYLAF